MRTSYFKARKPFSSSTHSYDLGTFLGLWRSHDDNHFLLKIYRIEEKEFSHYYNYHLDHTLENKIASEEEFLRHVWQIVQNRIKHYEAQDPFSRNHASHRQSIQATPSIVYLSNLVSAYFASLCGCTSSLSCYFFSNQYTQGDLK